MGFIPDDYVAKEGEYYFCGRCGTKREIPPEKIYEKEVCEKCGKHSVIWRTKTEDHIKAFQNWKRINP